MIRWSLVGTQALEEDDVCVRRESSNGNSPNKDEFLTCRYAIICIVASFGDSQTFVSSNCFVRIKISTPKTETEQFLLHHADNFWAIIEEEIICLVYFKSFFDSKKKAVTGKQNCTVKCVVSYT
jgi:hypothetical protein